MKYVMLALQVLCQNKGTSPASLKIQEGIIESVREKLASNVSPTEAERAQISALLPHLEYPDLADELKKFIER